MVDSDSHGKLKDPIVIFEGTTTDLDPLHGLEVVPA